MCDSSVVHECVRFKIRPLILPNVCSFLFFFFLKTWLLCKNSHMILNINCEAEVNQPHVG